MCGSYNINQNPYIIDEKIKQIQNDLNPLQLPIYKTSFSLQLLACTIMYMLLIHMQSLVVNHANLKICFLVSIPMMMSIEIKIMKQYPHFKSCHVFIYEIVIIRLQTTSYELIKIRLMYFYSTNILNFDTSRKSNIDNS